MKSMSTKTRSCPEKGEQVVLYLRVSTADQAEKDLSIPAQRDTLRRHCHQNGYTIVREYVEPGKTAKDDARPVFKQMIADVLASGSSVNTILVYMTSRFMRNTFKAQLYKTQLRKAGVRVIAVQQPTTDDAHGHFIEHMFEAFDEFESEINGVRTAAAMRENVRQGNFNGSSAPYGFRIHKEESRPGLFRGKMVPNAEEIPIVREVLRLYVGGAGAKATARELNQRGVRYRQGKLWTRDMVLRIVSEEALVGNYHWGKTDHRTGQQRPRSEWIPLKVEPIIDRELFDMAQAVRRERDPERSPGRTASSPMLLAGLVRCGSCGATYTLEMSGKGHRYYNCRAFTRTGKEACAGYRIPQSKLDDAVLAHLADKLFTLERCREILRDFVEEVGIMRQKTTEHRKQLEREIGELNRRIERWEEAFETRREDADVIMPKLRDLRGKRDELAATLSKIVPLRAVPPHLYNETTIRKFQENIRELFLSKDTSLTRNYLRFLVQDITVRGAEITIRGRTDAAVALLASGAEPGSSPLNQSSAVLTSVVDWRPRRDLNARPSV